jgi:hypothetical protein
VKKKLIVLVVGVSLILKENLKCGFKVIRKIIFISLHLNFERFENIWKYKLKEFRRKSILF